MEGNDFTMFPKIRGEKNFGDNEFISKIITQD